MIEDSPTTINELVKVVKVLYYDTRYNRKIEHEHITRVYTKNLRTFQSIS